LEKRMAVEVEKMGPGKWCTHDRKGRPVWLRYDGQWILVVRSRKRRKPELLLRKPVYNAFGPDLPDWYARMIMERVVEDPSNAHRALNTFEAKQMMDNAERVTPDPTAVIVIEEQSKEPLNDLLAHVKPDEKPLKNAPVGHTSRPAMLVVTDRRLLWRLTEPGSPVLTLNFNDICEVRAEGDNGIRVTCRPSDFPDTGRQVNGNGELDAEFFFQGGNDDVREMVHGRAKREVEVRTAGATLARGVGYLSGVSKGERYQVDVEAHRSGLVIYLGALPMWICGYSAVTSFSEDPVPEGLIASKRPGVGSAAVWLTLAGEGVKDRWRLGVKPDHLERWRVILEHFGVRDAARN
jgi:hypothetical protein